MTRLDGTVPQAAAQAARRLAEGELVAFATETVYGLGARADDDAAVAKIFHAKGRPADHPLIVHVTNIPAAAAFCDALPPLAQRLMTTFWPGPLTVIVARRRGVAEAAAGGHATIGLRAPAHPLAQALLAEAAALGVPGIAAPSANRYGRISPTRAAHVRSEFADVLPDLCVLDGGDCAVGIESSIIDCSRGHAVLLRSGVLTRAQLEAAAGEPLREADASAPRASGTLASHYAPRATLRLMSGAALRSALEVLPLEALPASSPRRLAVYSRSTMPPRLAGRRMPDDAAAAAHELFAVLRSFDDEGVQLIWVEEPPPDAAWDGVRDRLRRAATR
ncbi:MAG: threonylcarbamoyl-AMP synthase [Methylibium sp.]|nr:threonylcarbamoyl-AMP synthase [Methylibium sp.]